MDLSDAQVKWLCNHLGHSFDVHNEFYKLKLDAVELTHIAQTLEVSESGLLSKFKGKKIEEVKLTNVEDLQVLEEVEDFGAQGVRFLGVSDDEENNEDEENNNRRCCC